MARNYRIARERNGLGETRFWAEVDVGSGDWSFVPGSSGPDREEAKRAAKAFEQRAAHEEQRQQKTIDYTDFVP